MPALFVERLVLGVRFEFGFSLVDFFFQVRGRLWKSRHSNCRMLVLTIRYFVNVFFLQETVLMLQKRDFKSHCLSCPHTGNVPFNHLTLPWKWKARGSANRLLFCQFVIKSVITEISSVIHHKWLFLNVSMLRWAAVWIHFNEMFFLWLLPFI